MSITPDFSEAGRFSGRESVRGQDPKSNFSQTCSLLSQYLKENGSFGDLSLGMSRNVEVKSEVFRPTSTRNVKSMDLFPQHAGFGASSTPMETLTLKADFSAPKEPETAQMTIFYAGKVHVFDNFSMDKVKEIMLLANKASSLNHSVSASGNECPINGSVTITGSNNLTQEIPERIPQRIASDLPIARKASLQRFLEKRKDRINSRAPYQINHSSSVSVSGPVSVPVPVQAKGSVENKTWLGLASQMMNPLELQL